MTAHEIRYAHGREVLDSRGNPTVEVEITLGDGAKGRAIVPSGASTGIHEALELRDKDPLNYQGKGVQLALESIHAELFGVIQGMDATRQREIDLAMIALDGKANKSRLGANALLGVSLAVAHAAADSLKMPLYQYLGGFHAHRLPMPMLNMLNGGAHADNPLDIQEFMVAPLGAKSFRQAMLIAHEITHHLRLIIKKSGHSTNVGDEGGFAPNLDSAHAAIEMLLQAIHAAGLEPGKEAAIALDCASSEYFQDGHYHMRGAGKTLNAAEHVAYLESLCDKYPIYSIEDGMAEEDWEGWALMSETLGQRVQLVGDDLFVTNPEKLLCGVKKKIGNALLVKVNQIGTLSEAATAVEIAHRAGYKCVMSHRSGETEDTTIADLAVALNCGQIKTGALARGERTAKYNQLLRIEEQLGSAGAFGLHHY